MKNRNECFIKCSHRRRNGKLANGATVDAATGKLCYCEYGQTGRNNARRWKNTFIRPCESVYFQNCFHVAGYLCVLCIIICVLVCKRSHSASYDCKAEWQKFMGNKGLAIKLDFPFKSMYYTKSLSRLYKDIVLTFIEFP